MGTEASVNNIKISLEDIFSPDEGFLSHCLKGTQVKNPTGDHELGSSWQRPGCGVIQPLSSTDTQNNFFLSQPQSTQSLLQGAGAMVVQLQGDHAEFLTEWMSCLPDYGRHVLYFGIDVSLWAKIVLYEKAWNGIISFVMRQNSIDSRDRLSLKLSSTIYQMWPWANQLTSLGLSFLICKMGNSFYWFQDTLRKSCISVLVAFGISVIFWEGRTLRTSSIFPIMVPKAWKSCSRTSFILVTWSEGN